MSVRFELPREHPGVALVTIDRPERTNALDPETLQALATTWRRIAASPEIRCAVLTGAGDRAFCAGMDMRLTIPAAQRLARGETVTAEEFEGLRSVSTALLAGFDLATPVVSEKLVRPENVEVFGGLGNALLGYAASATPASIGRRIGGSGPPLPA